VTRTLGAAVGAVIFVLFLAECAAHLGPLTVRPARPVATTVAANH
jgi:hypothetical protein